MSWAFAHFACIGLTKYQSAYISGTTFRRFKVQWNHLSLKLCSIMVINPFDPYEVFHGLDCISVSCCFAHSPNIGLPMPVVSDLCAKLWAVHFLIYGLRGIVLLQCLVNLSLTKTCNSTDWSNTSLVSSSTLWCLVIMYPLREWLGKHGSRWLYWYEMFVSPVTHFPLQCA